MTGTPAPMLPELQRNWNELGKQDPFWAILSDPAKRGGGWDPAEFFQTGREDVARLLADVEALGIQAQRGRALDFGCGVGRLTQALCDHFEQVVGVDIAASMLELANRYNRFPGRCAYRLNEASDLAIFPSDHFDLVYSVIVLQHMVPPLSLAYITELVRVLAPGGILVFQVPGHVRPEYAPPESVPSVVSESAAPASVAAPPAPPDAAPAGGPPRIEMHGVSRGVVLQTLEQAGGLPVDVREDALAGKEWVGYRYFVTKD